MSPVWVGKGVGVLPDSRRLAFMLLVVALAWLGGRGLYSFCGRLAPPFENVYDTASGSRAAGQDWQQRDWIDACTLAILQSF